MIYNFTRSNTEKCNIAIAILEKWMIGWHHNYVVLPNIRDTFTIYCQRKTYLYIKFLDVALYIFAIFGFLLVFFSLSLFHLLWLQLSLFLLFFFSVIISLLHFFISQLASFLYCILYREIGGVIWHKEQQI